MLCICKCCSSRLTDFCCRISGYLFMKFGKPVLYMMGSTLILILVSSTFHPPSMCGRCDFAVVSGVRVDKPFFGGVGRDFAYCGWLINKMAYVLRSAFTFSKNYVVDFPRSPNIKVISQWTGRSSEVITVQAAEPLKPIYTQLAHLQLAPPPSAYSHGKMAEHGWTRWAVAACCNIDGLWWTKFFWTSDGEIAVTLYARRIRFISIRIFLVAQSNCPD